MSDASGIGAGKVFDKKAHFRAGAIDFTAGSLGKSNDFNYNLQNDFFLVSSATLFSL